MVRTRWPFVALTLSLISRVAMAQTSDAAGQIDPCALSNIHGKCMSDVEVRATVPQPYWPLWGVHVDGETERSMWAAFPCESIALTRGGGLILLPGQDFRVTLERGGNARLDARDEDTIVSSTGRVDLWAYGRLCFLAEHTRVVEMAPGFSFPATDNQVTTVTVVKDGRETNIYNEGEVGPIDLWGLEQAIDNVRRTIAWKQVSTMKAQ